MSSKTKTTQQTAEKTDPWAPMIPYLQDAATQSSGIFNKYRNLTPDQTAAVGQGADLAKDRLGSSTYGAMDDASKGLLSGDYAAQINPVAQARPQTVNFGGGSNPAGGMFHPKSPNDIQYAAAVKNMTGTVSAPELQTMGSHDPAAPSPSSPPGAPPAPTGAQAAPGGGMFGAGMPTVQAPQMTAAQVDPAAARAAQGPADPTAAIQKTLSGQVDNPQLAAMAQAATRQAQRTYGDAVSDSTDALGRSILPQVRAGAQISGQYGGSRQGIAEGLAIGDQQKALARGARDLGIATGDAASNLYGNAYEGAQGRMASMADNVDSRAQSTALSNAQLAQQGGMFNAGNALDASKFNAGNAVDIAKTNAGLGLDYSKLNTDIGFQNNQQALDASQQRVAQLGAGAGMFGQLGDMQNADSQQLLNYLGYPAKWEEDLMAPYAGVVTGIGGLGRQSTGTSSGTSTTSDPWGTAAKLAQAAATAYASDGRLKRGVKTAAYDDKGRRWVEFNYIWEPADTPPHLGVIAQEVRETDPDAVAEHPAGYLVVNYSMLEA